MVSFKIYKKITRNEVVSSFVLYFSFQNVCRVFIDLTEVNLFILKLRTIFRILKFQYFNRKEKNSKLFF